MDYKKVDTLAKTIKIQSELLSKEIAEIITNKSTYYMFPTRGKAKTRISVLRNDLLELGKELYRY
ncbi:MAG: hypothetical protein PHS04_16530 [Tissierellia bacterium]|jgi:non-homologous end joining protein Ku|nr:hypothetical protein [Tissierellia bacterium]